MNKQVLMIVTTFILGLALVGCSFLPDATATVDTSVSGAATTLQPGQNPNGQGMPLQDKLGYGLLKLEGTDQAVTAEQAAALLPLWKAVKSLSNSDTTSQDEVNGIYTQISEGLTDEQVKAIEDLNLSQDDLQALMKEYNIEMPAGPGNGNMPAQNGTPPAGQSGDSTGRTGGGMGAGGDMGGGMPPDMAGGGPQGGGDMGGMQGGMGGAAGGSATTSGTPMARPAGVGRSMNTLWLDAVIELLTERAG